MYSIWTLIGAAPGAENTEVITMEKAEQEGQSLTQQKDTQRPADTGEGKQPNPWVQMLPFFIIIIVMYLLLFRGPRRKQQEHQKMVSSLKKNDRVRTIGGIFGTVVDVRPDDIVLKIDESNNTKIHILPSAIATVLSEEKK